MWSYYFQITKYMYRYWMMLVSLIMEGKCGKIKKMYLFSSLFGSIKSSNNKKLGESSEIKTPFYVVPKDKMSFSNCPKKL